MGVLDSFNLTDLPEEKALPAGEYEVMLLSAEEYTGKQSGKTSIRVVFSVPNEADAQDIFHYIALPQPEDDPKTTNRKLRRLRDFLNIFGLQQSTPYLDWQGRKAWALLAEEEDQNGEMRNTIKRFISGTDTKGFDTNVAF